MVCDYRLDLRLTELLLIFKQKMEAGKRTPTGEKLPAVSVDFVEKRIEELFHLLDLDAGSGKYVPILLDLVLYEHQELAAAAANLLVRHYSQRAELIKALQQVQILVSYKNITIYQTVQQRVEELRKLTNSSVNNAQEEELKKILIELSALCADTIGHSEDSTEIIPITPATNATTFIPNHEHQRILHNQGVHHAVIDLLRIWAEHNRFELFVEAFEFLTRCCSSNAESQQALFPDLDFFLGFLRTGDDDRSSSRGKWADKEPTVFGEGTLSSSVYVS